MTVPCVCSVCRLTAGDPTGARDAEIGLPEGVHEGYPLAGLASRGRRARARVDRDRFRLRRGLHTKPPPGADFAGRLTPDRPSHNVIVLGRGEGSRLWALDEICQWGVH